MPLVDLTIEEMKEIVEHFNLSDEVVDEDAYTGICKLADFIDFKSDLVRCSQEDCEIYFSNSANAGECPQCGYYNVSIGDRVIMPHPKQGEGWDHGDEGVITGTETIDGSFYAIILCDNTRSWCIEANRLTM